MKRLVLSLALALVFFAPILPYGEYRISDGVVVRVYWHSWPDIWTLVAVEPA